MLLYALQLAEYSDSGFSQVFEGAALEVTLNTQEMTLKPGSAYKLRAFCSNIVGSSPVSSLLPDDLDLERT